MPSAGGEGLRTPERQDPRARERRAVRDIFTSWHGAPVGPLERVFVHLVPVRHNRRADRPLLNTQISVDTGSPRQLRLTMDPLAGEPFRDANPPRALRAVRDLGCTPLETSVRRLYETGCELPQNLWIGLAPGAEHPTVKAYVSTRTLGASQSVARAARAAGWLPRRVAPEFAAIYERLVPVFANVEGIGLAYSGDSHLGTTVYLRAVRPWSVCVSENASAFIGMPRTLPLRRLTGIFGGPPAVFGWSLECDAYGALVDIKLEIGVDGWFSRDALTDLMNELGIVTAPIDALSEAIAAAGLCEGRAPTPAFTSLRIVGDRPAGVATYFPLTSLG